MYVIRISSLTMVGVIAQFQLKILIVYQRPEFSLSIKIFANFTTEVVEGKKDVYSKCGALLLYFHLRTGHGF